MALKATSACTHQSHVGKSSEKWAAVAWIQDPSSKILPAKYKSFCLMNLMFFHIGNFKSKIETLCGSVAQFKEVKWKWEVKMTRALCVAW